MEISRIFAAGGIVMYPLLGFSILAIALIAERIKFWLLISQRQRRLVKEVLSIYRHGDPEAAIAKLQAHTNIPIARIFLAALALDQPSPEEFRLALESEAQAEIPILKRFNTLFETIISLSPLLGLLGTVLGLINSFASINLGDSSKIGGVTAGISEALVSTASGLVVAIFTLLFANTFRGLYKSQIALIQEYGGQLELLYRHRYDRSETISHSSNA